MLDLLRRAAVLIVASVAGISLLAPVAAGSGSVLSPEVDHLLSAADAPVAATGASRTLLSGRSQSSNLSLRGAAAALAVEAIDRQPLPNAPAGIAPGALFRSVATPAPTPMPAARRAAPPISGGAVWDRLAQCESSGNWQINTGNGYYGGLQFNLGTWAGYGGGAYAARPDLASREQQIAVAERLRAARGYAPWPACSRKLGLL